MKIMEEAYPDHAHFEKNSLHFEPCNKEDNSKQSMMDAVCSNDEAFHYTG